MFRTAPVRGAAVVVTPCWLILFISFTFLVLWFLFYGVMPYKIKI